MLKHLLIHIHNSVFAASFPYFACKRSPKRPDCEEISFPISQCRYKALRSSQGVLHVWMFVPDEASFTQDVPFSLFLCPRCAVKRWPKKFQFGFVRLEHVLLKGCGRFFSPVQMLDPEAKGLHAYFSQPPTCFSVVLDKCWVSCSRFSPVIDTGGHISKDLIETVTKMATCALDSRCDSKGASKC